MPEGSENFESKLTELLGVDSLPESLKNAIKESIKESAKEYLKESSEAAAKTLKDGVASAEESLKRLAKENFGKGSGFAAAWDSFWEGFDVLISKGEPDIPEAVQKPGESDADFKVRKKKEYELYTAAKAADRIRYFALLFKKHIRNHFIWHGIADELSTDIERAKKERDSIMEKRRNAEDGIKRLKPKISVLKDRIERLKGLKALQSKYKKDLDVLNKERSVFESHLELPERYKELGEVIDKKSKEYKEAMEKSDYYKDQSERASYHYLKEMKKLEEKERERRLKRLKIKINK